MKREEIEELVGESMEDMGLVENVEEKECACGNLIEDGNETDVCNSCQIEMKLSGITEEK